MHKIVKMRQLVKQLQVGAKHNADKTAWNIGEWLWGFVLTGITAYEIIG